MNGWAMYLLLGAILVVLAYVAVSLARPRRESGLDAAMPTLLDSVKSMSAVQTQVASLANAQSVVVQSIGKLEVALKGVEAKFAETTGDVKQTISRDVSDARKVLAELKTRFEDQARREDEIHLVTRRIERVLVGPRRGGSGENILADAFAQFPPEMIDKNFRVKGKVVEYAIVLPNKKRLPIDSKWGGAEVIERIEKETEPDRVKRLEEEIEREVQRRVREVAAYIDPASTTNIAIAAVPDSVYSLCKRVHIEAFKTGVLLMAYSMVVPYILALYHLHLQFARSIDFENVESYITQIERSLAEMDTILENKIARANAMASNAYSECKQLIGSMHTATAFLRELPPAEGEGRDRPAERGEAAI